jgi:uncharacterized repeat protein (TIGR03803 family)
LRPVLNGPTVAARIKGFIMKKTGLADAVFIVGFLAAAQAHAGSTQVIYSFSGGPDGRAPLSNLHLIGSTFYGTTEFGGTGGCSQGCGTVFAVSPAGKESIVYSFQGGTDGANPTSDLIDTNGTLYGTTQGGGSGTDCAGGAGCGTVFSVTQSGAETVLHAFQGGSDGAVPFVGLLSLNSTLYGVTEAGGASNAGTAFSIAGNTYSVLYSFKGGPNDGNGPESDLVNIGNTLYGTTASGGDDEIGTAFSLTTQGTETVLHSFVEKKDGLRPSGRLLLFNGQLYGTTQYGRNLKFGNGTIFRITGAGKFHKFYAFPNDGSGGSDPNGDLIDVNGVLYGTTSDGGQFGLGTVFSVTASGVETVLHSFQGGSDGNGPIAGLAYANGVLYGTTFQGGGTGCGGPGCGTIFAVTP